MSKCDKCIQTYVCSKRMKNKGGCTLYKPITQADRIRSMSDEELKEFLARICNDTLKSGITMDSEEWEDWLQSEVEE